MGLPRGRREHVFSEAIGYLEPTSAPPPRLDDSSSGSPSSPRPTKIVFLAVAASPRRLDLLGLHGLRYLVPRLGAKWFRAPWLSRLVSQFFPRVRPVRVVFLSFQESRTANRSKGVGCPRFWKSTTGTTSFSSISNLLFPKSGVTLRQGSSKISPGGRITYRLTTCWR